MNVSSQWAGATPGPHVGARLPKDLVYHYWFNSGRNNDGSSRKTTAHIINPQPPLSPSPPPPPPPPPPLHPEPIHHSPRRFAPHQPPVLRPAHMERDNEPTARRLIQ